MDFTESELEELAFAAREAAEAGGKVIREGAKSGFRVDFKGEVDLVTDVDRRAEEVVTSMLEKRYPRIGILAEEDGARGSESIRWIVDPLDGTTNFAHGHPFVATSVGLQVDQKLVAGAVCAPRLGWTQHAYVNGGTRMIDEKIHVSTTPVLDRALLATGYPYNRRTARNNNSSQHAAFIRLCQGVRRCGAATIDCALLAAGVYDGFWEPGLKPWDLAAGVLLITEAGGTVSGYDGKPIDIFEGNIVASNGLIHDEMMDVLKQTGAGVR